MSDLPRSAIELFNIFRARCRAIWWQPVEFVDYEERVHVAPYFDELSLVGDELITNGSIAGSLDRQCLLPFFDLRAAGLKFSIEFDPTNSENFCNVIHAAPQAAVKKQVLDGHQFFVDPLQTPEKKFFHDRCAEFSVGFTREDGEIPGFQPSSLRTQPWTFFIPRERDRRAITAAIELERLEDQARRKSGLDFDKATTALTEALQSV